MKKKVKKRLTLTTTLALTPSIRCEPFVVKHFVNESFVR